MAGDGLQGKVHDPSLPVLQIAACDEQDQFRNCIADRQAVVDDEDPRHGQAARHALASVERHGRPIVCYHDPRVLGRPCEDAAVVSAAETVYILNSQEVNVRLLTQKPSHNIAVEVLVNEEPQHLQSRSCSRARILARIPLISPCCIAM